jgi:hypothetical protein
VLSLAEILLSGGWAMPYDYSEFTQDAQPHLPVPLMYVPTVPPLLEDEGVSEAPSSSSAAATEPPGTLHHMWSAVLGCAFWVMETDAQAKTQRAQGRTAYSRREVTLLQALQEQRPDTFPETLRTLHTYRDVFEATLEEPESATATTTRRRAAPLTAGDVRAAVRTAMGHGLRVWHEGDVWRFEDKKRALPARMRERLLASGEQQTILESCYVLGPILPPCEMCGELRVWLDRDAATWRCWACVPPLLRTPTAEEAA